MDTSKNLNKIGQKPTGKRIFPKRKNILLKGIDKRQIFWYNNLRHEEISFDMLLWLSW